MIIGKISGINATVYRKKFELIELKLIACGYEVFNPCKIQGCETWEEYMSACLAQMLFSDGIYACGDWGQSKGARIEHATAIALNKPIFYEGGLKQYNTLNLW